MRVTLHKICFVGFAIALVVAAAMADESATAVLTESPALASPVTPKGLVQEEPASGLFVATDRGYMVPYTEMIPGSDVEFEMIPVPGGKFTFGSPEDTPDRGEYELPPVEVELPPFWIARHEITWAAYWKFMRLNDDFATLQTLKTLMKSDKPQVREAVSEVVISHPHLAAAVEGQATAVDGVTAPTALYDSSTTYECGKDPQQPAATMTPYAAKQFTKWLSRTTGADYRLPTEAEWEYAARAGSTTAFPFGDEPAELAEYAWYDENSDAVTHPVGEKKPNTWGLYDMLGNVGEWVIDQYDAEPATHAGGATLHWEQAIRWPTEANHRIVRGGFYDLTAEECRSTSRFYSEDRDWKGSDPNLPLSPWWYTDWPSTGVGIRLVRSLAPLSPELAGKFWEIDSKDIAADVANRLQEGRGKFGAVNADLPKVQAVLEDDSVRALLEGGK